MANQINYTKMVEQDFFFEAVHMNPITSGSVIFSTVAWLLALPLYAAVIWYERNDFEKYQVFTNKLVSSICCTVFQLFIFGHMTSVYRYLVGPMSEFVCLSQIVIRRSAHKQVVLLLDAIMLTRALFVFVLSNPLAFKDNYWIVFTNIWIGGFAFINQFVSGMLEGHDTLEFLFCTGTDPTRAFELPRAFTGSVEVVSLMAMIIIQAKIYLHKKRTALGPQTQRTFKRSLVLREVDNVSIATFATDFMILLFIISAIAIQAFTSKVPWQDYAHYPHHLRAIYVFLIGPGTAVLIVALSYFVRHENLRKTVIREVVDQLSGMWPDIMGKYKN